jgi:hypothetical protein
MQFHEGTHALGSDLFHNDTRPASPTDAGNRLSFRLTIFRRSFLAQTNQKNTVNDPFWLPALYRPSIDDWLSHEWLGDFSHSKYSPEIPNTFTRPVKIYSRKTHVSFCTVRLPYMWDTVRPRNVIQITEREHVEIHLSRI